jgi:hypothetical protein
MCVCVECTHDVNNCVQLQGFTMVAKLMDKAWEVPRVGHDLAYMLCDYLRETQCLPVMLKQFVTPTDDGNQIIADEVRAS